MSDLRFYLSDVQVDLICPHEDVLRGLKAIWSSANTAQVRVERHVILEVESTDRLGILCDGELINECSERNRLLPLVEQTLYELLHKWLSNQTLIHGSLVSKNHRPLLMVGPSDSGKSSLALQARQRGWTYMTDELTITDGKLLWGVTRAIQFDATMVVDELPRYLRGADTSAYQWTDEGSGRLYQPIFEVTDQAGLVPVASEDLCIVFLQSNSEAGVQSVPAISALAQLHSACFHPPVHDLGALVNHAWSLQWRDPVAAFDMIERLPTFLDVA